MDKSKEIVLNIYRASNLFERLGRVMAVEVGLSSVQQWFILGALYRQGEMALKDFSRDLLVTKQNITGMVKRLKDGGYLTTSEDTADRRITRARITDKGRDAFERLVELSKASNSVTFGGFAGEELGTLAGLLERLVADMQAPREDKL